MIYVYAEIANDYLMHASSGMEYICVRWVKIICKYLRERDFLHHLLHRYKKNFSLK